MSTLVLGDQPEIADWLERRRALGRDDRDEVWEGVYHVAPLEQPHNAIVAAEVLSVLRPRADALELRTLNPFNLGLDRTDFRCPDGGWIRRDAPLSLYLPTAVAVLEVLSPDDETYAKLPHYAARGVQEVLVAHPTERWVACHVRRGERWEQDDEGSLFTMTMTDLTAQVDWP